MHLHRILNFVEQCKTLEVYSRLFDWCQLLLGPKKFKNLVSVAKVEVKNVIYITLRFSSNLVQQT